MATAPEQKAVVFPEQTIRSILETGITVLLANPSYLDKLWTGLSTDDLTRLKSVFASNPPTVISGYARGQEPFPLFAVTLLGDNPDTDFLGHGEHWMDVDEDDAFDTGELAGLVRTKGSFGIFVYAHHADVCAAYYRVARFVINSGRKALVAAGLDDPTLSGVELRPDTRYTPDNVYVRQLTLTVDYEEVWSMEGVFATAFGTAPASRLSPTGTIVVEHEDQFGADDDGIQPYDYDPDGVA